MEKLLLTTEETAEVLGISHRQVFHLLANARIESITIGRSRRIPRDAVEQYVQQIRSEQRLDVA